MTLSEQDDTTRPAKRGIQLPFERRPPLATARGGRDPSDATRVENEKTIHIGSSRTVLLGRSSQRTILDDGIVQDGDTLIIDAKAEPVK